MLSLNEKKVNILITFKFYQLLFFIFDKFVDDAQPEVAGEMVGRRHILRTLRYKYMYTTTYLHVPVNEEVTMKTSK
jgi:hypothetical protein